MSEWRVIRPEVANTPHQVMQFGDNQAQFLGQSFETGPQRDL
jgi:hypothetical protein